MIRSVLIVGASVAGVGAANELRRCGFAGEITLIDAQPHLPYDRPPLSKAALSDGAVATRFHDAAHYEQLGIVLSLGDAAVALDVGARKVMRASGAPLTADAVIIATGSRARRLPTAIAEAPIHVIRDLDDVTALRPHMQPHRRLVLIGGGFIGAEVAATARKHDVDVTIIDRDPLPLSHILGAEVARRIGAFHIAAGVRLACGTGIDRIVLENDGAAVLLRDGSRIAADIVVAGIGSAPNVEWLAGSGITIGDGVVCDEVGRTSAAGVYAAGDVAAWRDADGAHHRHEHWTAAREQARIVAQQIVGKPEAIWSAFVPYFWSDMHGKRLQLLGEAAGATQVDFVFDAPETGAFVAEYRRSGALIGVVGCNAAARVMRYTPQLSQGCQS